MAQQGQGGEKTEEATPKRRQDARNKGQAAKSQDLVQAISLLAASALLPWAASAAAETLLKAINAVGTRMPQTLTPQTAISYTGQLLVPLSGFGAAMLGTLMVIGVSANLAQVGLLWSSEAVKPTFNKINPAEGIKRIFSKRAFFEGLKALFKMAVFGWIVYSVISGEWPRLVGASGLKPHEAASLIGGIVQTIMVRVSITWLALAALDYFFQKKEFDEQIKMTKTELKQEMKEQEGAPEVKMARMRQRRKLSKGSLAKRVQEASVIVTNPTHFAIALSYDRSKTHAPIVVAKGQDYLALKIREIAGDLDIPIVENKPLARALYKECEVGDAVPRSLFGPVAEVLAYVYKTFKKVRSAA